MQEQVITLETAKIAKDKGFDLESPAYYGCDEPSSGETNRFFVKTWLRCDDINKKDTQEGTLVYSAPYKYDLQKWLREKHHINVLVNFETIDDSETAYTWHIKQYIEEGNNRKKDTWDFYEDLYSFSADRMQWFDTYEQALEDGLREALKLVTV